EVLATADALEREIVNREDRQRALEARAKGLVGAHRDRGGRGMPIVRVNYVRRRREYLGAGDGGGAAKEGEAAQVVGIVDAVLAVDFGPSENCWMVDQIHLHAMWFGRAQHREAFAVGAESDRDVAQQRRGLDAFRD